MCIIKNNMTTNKNRALLFEHFFASPSAVFLAFFFVCLLAYAKSFQNGFMLDDHIILFGQSGVLNKSFLGLFTFHQGDFYRPVGHIPLWIFSRLLASNYIAYHVVNFSFFVSIVFLFFILVRKITSDATLSFLSALLYAIHPLNAMIINYITASVLAVFVLSMQMSFLFFIFFLERGQKRDYIFSLIFFILACLSHEMAMMLPVYLTVYLFLVKKEDWNKIFQLLLPFALFLMGWLAFRIQDIIFQHQLNNPVSAVAVNMAAFFSTWMDLAIWYVSSLFFPSKVIFLWSNPYGQEHLLRNVIIFALAVGLSAYAFLQWKKSWKSFLLMVFILGFFPTVFTCFGNFPRVWPSIEPHWFYFSQIGFFVLIGSVLLALARKSLLVGGVCGISVIFLLLIGGWSYNSRWKSQETYSIYWLSLNPGNLTPYYGLGSSLMDKGDYLGARDCFWSGYERLKYTNIQMAADLGHCFDMLGVDQVAWKWLSTASKWDDHYALTYHYIGLYFNKRGKLLEAQKAFEKSVELDPKFSSSYGYLK